jgi:pimeloyl-ACP methyl ester carboxylesterase
VALVARLQAPLAIVHGRADRFLPAREAVVLHRAAIAGRSRLTVVPAMGHAFDPLAVAVPAVVDAVAWSLHDPVEAAPAG